MKFPPLSLHGKEHKLKCPYAGCERTFEKPTILTDRSTIPSESYFACPYCMSKIDIVTENLKIVEIKPTDYPAKVFESPAKCAHFSGLLGGASTPEECLICPKVLQCGARKK